MRFLIIDGYDRATRIELAQAGATLAGQLYHELALRHAPTAHAEIITPADPDCETPDFAGITAALWTGSSLTAYDGSAPSMRQIQLARHLMEAGIPCFGSCWALQIACLAAGGTVGKNPKGREFGLARNITLTAAGQGDRIFAGRAFAFDGFSSHFDVVESLPAGSEHLAGNPHSPVQAARIHYGASHFLGLQYHPEYNMAEIAALARFRGQGLIDEGRFSSASDLQICITDWQKLNAEPDDLSLAWRYGISEDVLDRRRREQEFAAWLTTALNHKS